MFEEPGLFARNRANVGGMDDKPLAGQAALITGGGGGIGQASAAWLARDGAAVVIMGRTEATLLEPQAARSRSSPATTQRWSRRR